MIVFAVYKHTALEIETDETEHMADEAPEQIIINGQEYSPEDAQQLIELGSRARKIESDLNTSLDKVYPEYTKTSQRVKGLEAELEEARKAKDELAAFKKEQEDRKIKADTPEDVDAIRGNAKKYGILTEDAIKEKGYMTKTEVEEFYSQQENKQRLINQVNQEAEQLTKEIDGKDGRTRFNKKATMAYAATYGFNTLREAYEDMNQDSNADWKERQLAKAERPGLTTLKGGTKTKEPVKPKVTDDNFKQMWDELIDGGQE